MSAAKRNGDALAAPSFQSSGVTWLGSVFGVNPHSGMNNEAPLNDDCTKPVSQKRSVYGFQTHFTFG